METMTNIEVVARIKPSLLLPEDFKHQDSWIEQQVDDLALQLKGKIRRMSKGSILVPDDTIPSDLFIVIKQVVVFAFNKQRSEGMDTHTEGGEVMRWKSPLHDPLEPYTKMILDFVEETDYANGFSFYS